MLSTQTLPSSSNIIIVQQVKPGSGLQEAPPAPSKPALTLEYSKFGIYKSSHTSVLICYRLELAKLHVPVMASW